MLSETSSSKKLDAHLCLSRYINLHFNNWVAKARYKFTDQLYYQRLGSNHLEEQMEG